MGVLLCFAPITADIRSNVIHLCTRCWNYPHSCTCHAGRELEWATINTVIRIRYIRTYTSFYYICSVWATPGTWYLLRNNSCVPKVRALRTSLQHSVTTAVAATSYNWTFFALLTGRAAVCCRCWFVICVGWSWSCVSITSFQASYQKYKIPADGGPRWNRDEEGSPFF